MLRANERFSPFKGFPGILSFSRCNIEFSRAGGTKRSIGQFNGWDVNSKLSVLFSLLSSSPSPLDLSLPLLPAITLDHGIPC